MVMFCVKVYVSPGVVCAGGGGCGIFAVFAYLCASDLTYMMRTHRILCVFLGPFVCL